MTARHSPPGADAPMARGRVKVQVKDLLKNLDRKRLPRHVAVIMDGNGRWAAKKALSRIFGHREGVKAVRDTVKTCRELNIPYVTLYAFSKENWDRPGDEVHALMGLLKKYLVLELRELNEHNIKLQAIGDLSDLPQSVRTLLKIAMDKTKRNTSMVLNLALSYGGRTDIIQGMKRAIRAWERNGDGAFDIDEERFARYLSTAGMPDPDLLIRTSGEYRLSNFMLWQMAYTELYVTDTLWPDFRKKDLLEALLDYQRRERRFGLTGDQIRAREKTRHTRFNGIDRQ